MSKILYIAVLLMALMALYVRAQDEEVADESEATVVDDEASSSTVEDAVDAVVDGACTAACATLEAASGVAATAAQAIVDGMADCECASTTVKFTAGLVMAILA